MATNQQLRSGDKVGAMTRTYTLQRDTLDEDARTVGVTFSTESSEVERWFGTEILDHSPTSVRLGRLNNGGAFLMDHDSRDQRGVIERNSAEIVGRKGRATVRFSKGTRGTELMEEVKDGIREHVSVGYRVHELTLEKSDDSGDTYRVTDWEPFEVSSVAIPADSGAGMDRESQSMIWGDRAAELENSVRIINNNESPMKTDKTEASEPEKDEQRSDVAVETPATPEKPENHERGSSQSISAPAAPALTAKDVERAAANEADRRDEIRELAKAFSVDEKEVRSAIADKESVEAFKLRIFDTMKPTNQPIQSGDSESEGERHAPGTKAHTIETWGNEAIRALGSKGSKLSQIKVIEREDNRQFIDGGGRQFHRSLTGAVTLGQVAALDAGIGSSVINETTLHAPELDVFPVDIITGASVELSVQTVSPTVAYRDANEGAARVSAAFESKLFQTKIIEEQIAVDIQGVLNSSNNPGRVLENQTRAVTRAVMEHLASESWYAGTAQSGVDTKAPAGIIAQSNSAATHVVDAGGNSAKSSVWFLELGTGACDHIYGNDTTLNFGEWNEETVLDGSSNPLRALVNTLSGRFAARLANKNNAIRIKNIEEDTLKLTVEFMYSAMQLADTLGSQPNAIFMNPRSLYQLRDDMQGNNTSDTNVPPPTSWDGIPIYTTNNINVAETV